MLLDSPKINTIESNLISLFDRTFQKGLKNTSGPKLKNSVKNVFSSKTFEKQIDGLIDDLYLYSIDETDKLVKKTLKAGLQRSPRNNFLSAAENNTPVEPLVLTEEAVKECTELAEEITESIIRVLKDEAIYQEGPATQARRVLDLWGGEKYRAVRWARTFSADVATSTAIHRYRQHGIEYSQIYALLDDRTSPQCRMMNGTIFRVDSPEAMRYRTPFHHHCLVAGTKINTMEGEQNIEDVQKGTMVLTHLNRYMPVTNTMSREADDIIHISTLTSKLRITKNHPVLTDVHNVMTWVPAGSLKRGDKIIRIKYGWYLEEIQFIRDIEPETVFNLSVLTDESYTANGIIVHNCRTTILPCPVTMEIDPALLYENRDFSKVLNQKLKPLDEGLDSEFVEKTFGDIEKFKDKWAIPQFILDEDIEKRLMKLGVGITT